MERRSGVSLYLYTEVMAGAMQDRNKFLFAADSFYFLFAKKASYIVGLIKIERSNLWKISMWIMTD